MKIYEFKVIHPNRVCCYDLSIEANTQEDAVKELSERLRIGSEMLIFKRVYEANISEHGRIYNDFTIHSVRAVLDNYAVHNSHFQTQRIATPLSNTISTAAERLRGYTMPADVLEKFLLYKMYDYEYI